MKILIIIAIILFAGYFSPFNAQNIQVGLRIEPNGIRKVSEGESNNLNFNLFAFQINASVFVESKVAIELRGAVAPFLDYYSGLEAGLFGKYFFTEYAYFIGGVLSHRTIGDKHNTWEAFDISYILPGIGIGLNPFLPLQNHAKSLRADFEIMYLPVGNKTVGRQYNDLNRSINTPVQLKELIKMGIGLSYYF